MALNEEYEKFGAHNESAASVPQTLPSLSPTTASIIACHSNPGRLRYTRCHAILFVFEMDNIGGCLSEALSLKLELESSWGFCAEIYKIPFIDSPKQLQRKVEKAVSKFIKIHDGQMHLLLLHYGGHGAINAHGMYTLSMEHAGKTYDVYFNRIREQLMKCKADIAILLDACKSEAAKYRNYHRHTIEILAACAENKTTPGVGPKSFTSAILRILGNYDRDITLEELFEELKELKQPRLKADPVHCMLKKSKFGSITLQHSKRRCGVIPQTPARNWRIQIQQLWKCFGFKEKIFYVRIRLIPKPSRLDHQSMP